MAWFYTVRACDPAVEMKSMAAFEKLQLALRELEALNNQLAAAAGVHESERTLSVYPIVNPEPGYDASAVFGNPLDLDGIPELDL